MHLPQIYSRQCCNSLYKALLIILSTFLRPVLRHAKGHGLYVSYQTFSYMYFLSVQVQYPFAAVNNCSAYLELANYLLHVACTETTWAEILNNVVLFQTCALLMYMQWPVNKAPLSRSQSSVTLGLLNSDHADAVLDTGPPADSTEVSTYLQYCMFNVSRTQL